MKRFKEFRIPFVGLRDGEHQFDFQIDREFFDAFGFDEYEEVDFKVTLLLTKKTTFMELKLVADGTVKVPCDVTGEEFNMKVEGDMELVVKFGEAYNDERDDLLILPQEAYQIEVQQYIYELIVLSVPQKRVKPGAEDNELEDAEVLEAELRSDQEEKNSKEESTDPRWDQLKQLLDKK
ncbi:YceD family protein [Wenyingzhuangia sp. IMCC45574]